MIKFIVTGLPRSGTTWLSVFLSTDDCLCLHDPLYLYSKEDLENWTGGISDTGAWLDEKWCKANTDKLIVIDRNINDVNSSLQEMGLDVLPEQFTNKFQSVDSNRRFYFEDLFTIELAEELWSYIYPDKPFNTTRWIELKNIYMEPTKEIINKCKKGV